MTQETITIKQTGGPNIVYKRLTPAEGMVLTDGEIYAEKALDVPKTTAIGHWYEITLEEYEKIKSVQDKVCPHCGGTGVIKEAESPE